MKIVTGIVLLLGLCASVPAQQAKPCGGLDALNGEWVGTGTFVSADEVSLDFLIAPPGKDFAKYITATAKRKH